MKPSTLRNPGLAAVVAAVAVSGYAAASGQTRGPFDPQLSCSAAGLLTASGSATPGAQSAYLVYPSGASLTATVQHGHYRFLLASAQTGTPTLLRFVDAHGHAQDVKLDQQTFLVCAQSSSAVSRQQQALVAALGVFRRPQTAADRSLDLSRALPADPTMTFTPILGTLREAAVTQSGQRIYLMIFRQHLRPGQAAAVIGTFNADSRGKPEGLGIGLTLASVRVVRQLDAGGDLAHGGAIFSSVVPDGIKSVLWRFPAARGFTKPLPPLTARVRVTDNVAVAQLHRDANTRPTEVEWLAGDGHVLARYHSPHVLPISTSPSPREPANKVVAQINLSPPGRFNPRAAIGIAQIVNVTGPYSLVFAATRVPSLKARQGYALWLTGPTVASRLLGFLNPGPRHGRVTTTSSLPANIGSYKRILLTEESRPVPKKPGAIILQGTLPPVP